MGLINTSASESHSQSKNFGSLTARGAALPLTKEDFKTLSLSKARQLWKERDSELMERHNRILKLLVEEERSGKKIEVAIKKAQALNEVQQESHRVRSLCTNIVKREQDLHNEQVCQSAREIRLNRDMSPREALVKLYMQNQQLAKETKKESKRN
jgi:hypothetical protein